MTIDPDAPAFARPMAYGDYGRSDPGQRGMSIRTHLAGLAMQGFLACYGNGTDAQQAVKQADALIAALNKPTT